MAKILLADDDIILRTLFEQLLKRSGHEVVSAKDGEEAYRLFLESKPDIILSDHHMPGLKGLDLIMKIRQQGNYTPAILISGRDIFLNGVLQNIAILSKPVNHKSLLSLLDAFTYRE